MLRCLWYGFLVLVCWNSKAQSVQWAAKVLEVSSAYGEGKGPFSAFQACGEPDAPPGMGDAIPQAWSSLLPDAGEAFIRLGFARPVKGVQQIVIAEVLHPGALYRVYLESGSRAWLVHEVHRPHPCEENRRWYRIRLPPTVYPVSGIRVVLQTDKVPGYNLIDAIGISTDKEALEPTITQADWPVKGQREKLGSAVNSPFSEVHPLVSPDGQRLYFTRKDHPRNMGDGRRDDVWVSEWRKESWSKAKRLAPPVNGPGHDYLNGLTPDGRTGLLASTRDDPNGRESLFWLHAAPDGAWASPQRLDLPGLYNKNRYAAFHLALDGQTLLLSLERDDALGWKDIYVSFHQADGSWSEPRNLGPGINTVADETTPYLAADGRTLIFTTNGRYGYGSSDLFVSKRLDDTWTSWSEPGNLGPVINSPEWDANFSLTASGEAAYFTAVGAPESGEDIYRIALTPGQQADPVLMVHGLVREKGSGKALSASVYAAQQASESLAARSTADEQGYFEFVLASGHTYALWASHPGYFPEPSPLLDLRQESAFGEAEPVLWMRRVRPGLTMPLPGVQFEANDSELQASSYPALRHVAAFMAANPGWALEIGGHTNDLCGSDFCQELSELRARAVQAFLVGAGVAPERLVAIGYGKEEPAEPGTSPAAREANQRVELRFMDR